MLKNIRINVKLVAVGALLIMLPLVIVALITVQQSTAGLKESAYTQLSERADVIAEMID